MPTYETAWGEVAFSLRPKGDQRYVVEWPESDPEEVAASLIEGNRLVLTLGGRNVVAHVAKSEKGIEVFIGGRAFQFRHPSVERAGGAPESPSLSAPMPGLVVKVLVQEGEEVEAGQPVVVVEAMKMIHEICCSDAGVVRKVHFGEGDQVEAGVPIVEIEARVSPEES